MIKMDIVLRKYDLMKRIEKEYFKLQAVKMGETSRGGAETLYMVQKDNGDYLTTIKFQDRPVPDGVAGVTNEFLLEILIDRLEGFQSGEFPCEENAKALEYCKAALSALVERHEKRVNRGVQGKYEK